MTNLYLPSIILIYIYDDFHLNLFNKSSNLWKKIKKKVILY